MANTNTLSGNTSLTIEGTNTISGDTSGSRKASVSKTLTWAASGGTAPTITGFFKGTATCAAGNWTFSAADPLGSMGDAAWSDGYTPTAGKIKLLYVENTDSTNTITITRGATTTGDAFSHILAAGDGLFLAAGDFVALYKKAGGPTVTASNDILTIAVGAGSPTATVLCLSGD